MKLQLNKLMAGMVLAGSVVALVGCGSGDVPELLPSNIEAKITATDTNAVKLASNVAVALADEPIGLTPGAANNLRVPLGSSLTFDDTVPAGAIASATIESPDGRTLETTIRAGSCIFKVTGPADETKRIINTNVTPNRPYRIDDPATAADEAEEIIVTPCSITAEVVDIKAGQAPVERNVTITLGTDGTVTAKATIQRKGEELFINDKKVADVTATGGITVN